MIKKEFDFNQKSDFYKIEKELKWVYPELLKTKLPIKSTVSKIKQKQIENNAIDFEEFGKETDEKLKLLNIEPTFMKNEEVITGAKKGTLMHLFLQKIDFKEDLDIKKLEELKENLILKNIITQEEAKFINIFKIENFLKSDLFKKIKNAKYIQKEKTFCMKINHIL